MKLIVFSKSFKDRSVKQLLQLAHQYDFDGYDLCVRPGYAVTPDNAARALPQAAKLMKAEGLAIGMVTGNFDLLTPDHPTTVPILSAMDKADIRLIKLGYFKFAPADQDYWSEVDRIRKIFEDWQVMAQKYNIKICYHTHSDRCMGLNCAALMHLLQGFDPQYLGAYIDPAHMLIEGEEWAVGVAMVRKYLSIVALKDTAIRREVRWAHGKAVKEWFSAGQGMVDWTNVFEELVRVGYRGPLTVHFEHEIPEEQREMSFRHEMRFFRETLDRAVAKGKAAKKTAAKAPAKKSASKAKQ